MSLNAKRQALAWLAGITLLTILIAVALPQLQLKPGQPLPSYDTADAPGVSTSEPQLVFSLSAFWKAVLGLLVAAIVIYNGYKLLRTVTWSWKDILRTLPYLAGLVLVSAGLIVLLSRLRLTTQPLPQEAPPPPSLAPNGPPLGAPPAALLWLVWLALGAALVGLGLWFALRPARPDRLKLEAQQALHALKSGMDLKNVILQSYWQMTQVLKQEQGLELEAAMTTREFERLLEGRGMPSAPVHQLTQLFEAVRYGHQPPGADGERQAVDCLTAIVRYSQARERAR